ncbi:hypothetical protein [Leptolyngbya sp. 7M]|uniref:hypothetical protein n=1 Tax=Leptolyngbya sp. 7M TaxID=2812896 RepID=UPI001B8A951C|nr:hypothetical protein [Leptolyngbya sp. 7M]QYO65380.1 hypothetical protein JVX88_00940 [Leptolyngbya sp. 7M]
MSSRIVEAEYLHYRNPSRNSDKVFNIFLLEEDDVSYTCISEYGRRGTSLIRVVVCSKNPRPIAESAFRKKLEAKRNHRLTPYRDSPDGPDQSPLAKEYAFGQAPANRVALPKTVDFSETRKQVADRRMRINGILNQGQIDSLEF